MTKRSARGLVQIVEVLKSILAKNLLIKIMIRNQKLMNY